MTIWALVLMVALTARDPVVGNLLAASAAEPAQATGRSAPCLVPDVRGVGQAEAARRLRESRLATGRVERRTAPHPAGTVIGQQPEPCAARPENSRVDLVISSGPATTDTSDGDRRPPDGNRPRPPTQEPGDDGPSVGDIAVPVGIGIGLAVLGAILSRDDDTTTVPDLLNTPLAAAEATLRESHLRVGEVVTRASMSAPAGRVMEQSPRAGARVARDSVVAVHVSSGRPMTTVPDVAGMDWRDADTRVTGARLRMVTTNPPAGNEAVRFVESQVPEPGTPVLVGAAVAVTLQAAEQAGSPATPPAPPVLPDPPPVAVPTGLSPTPAMVVTASPPPPAAAPAPVTAPPALPGPAAPAAPLAGPAAPVVPPGAPPAAAIPPGAPPAAPAAPAAVPAVPTAEAAPLALFVALGSPWPWLWVLLLMAVGLFLWRQGRTPGDPVVPLSPAQAPPVVPRLTFVPRLDVGRQAITARDDERSHSFELALHMAPGTQSLQFEHPAPRGVPKGAVS